MNARFWRLPSEVWERIVDMLDGDLVGGEEVEEMRREFVGERKEFQRRHTRAMEEYLEWDLDEE